MSGLFLEPVKLATQEFEAGAGIARNHGKLCSMCHAAAKRYAGEQADQHLIDFHEVPPEKIAREGAKELSTHLGTLKT
ncbi:hypothetical protein GCM10007989_11230 [Devosia pacifica]|uniref:Uncharacterized protein n=1 Tax=Devosia pacifica TaxID=1335967 RepID=A0A918S088_9HYPH|nr:hypothetical protein GCM10007989_11230 [Devosia pacifica]